MIPFMRNVYLGNVSASNYKQNVRYIYKYKLVNS